LSEINRVLAEENGIGWGSLEAGPTKCTSRKSEIYVELRGKVAI